MPTKLKILRGNPGKRPLNDAEPRPQLGEPSCPPWLSKKAKAEWKLIVPELLKLGLLSIIDRAALSGYCQATAEVEEATRIIEKEGRILKRKSSGAMYTHPAVAIQYAAFKVMKGFLQEFGLSPSSRSRVKGSGSPVDVDPLSDLMGRNGQKQA